MNDGARIPSRNFIWVGGVIANPVTGLPEECFGRGKRILVDEYNRVKGQKNIFAIGDIAFMDADPSCPKGHPQMAQPAIQQGALLARNIRAWENGGEAVPFRYKDLGCMATIGKNKAVANIGGFVFGGFFAWLIWMGVHLMSILGVRNKLFVFLDWVWSYFTYDRSNRMILKARPSQEMNELEKRLQENHWGDIAPEERTQS